MTKKTIITIFFSAVMAFVLCGCSGGGIMDTYWRDNKTGEWLIGIVEKKVIYDCKVWGFSKMEENDGTYSLRARYGADSLDISFGSEQDGKRTITIGEKQYDCSLIEGRYLPDYPTKDTCKGFVDNGYIAGDSVTIEHYLNVHSWPTYKLFDRNGNLLDLKVDARDLEGLAGLLEKMK